MNRLRRPKDRARRESRRAEGSFFRKAEG